MKKIFIMLSVIIFSCEQGADTSYHAPARRKVEILCDTFLANHKNWNQNDIIHDKTNEDLKQALQNQIPKGILSDFPLKLFLINEYEKGKYAAQFHTDYRIKNNYDYNFDVIALISKEQGEKLKTDSLYGITGKFIKFLGMDFKNYTYAMVYSNVVQVTKNSVYEDSAAFDFGIILLDNPSFKIMK